MQVLKTLARVHVAPDALAGTIAFYECLLSERCVMRFPIAAMNVEIAIVSSIQIVAGTDDALTPFSAVRTAFFVDSVAAFEQALSEAHAKIVRPPQQGPHGWFMIVRHPDGMVAEYADAMVAGNGSVP